MSIDRLPDRQRGVPKPDEADAAHLVRKRELEGGSQAHSALQRREVEHAQAGGAASEATNAQQRHQAAEALGVSVATADNDWAYAKGWLKAELARTSGSG